MKSVIYVFFVSSALALMSCEKKNKIPEVQTSTSQEMDIQQISKKICDLFADTTETFHEGMKKFVENGKVGFINEKGNVVIKPIYDDAGCFNEGLVCVTVNNKTGYIDKTGKMVIEPKFDYANFFSQGLSNVSINGKWGYIDKTGKFVIEPKYEKADEFFEPNGFAAVGLNGKEGLIDRNGNIVFPIQFEHASSTVDGVAVIFDKNKEYNVYNNGSYKIITY